MRRAVSGSAALLGLLLLASCALTPPVLGGRPTAGPAPGEYTDEDVVALLIVDDPDAENVVLDVADYRAEEVGDVAVTCPGSALLLPDDAAGGSVIVSPPLFRERPGADLLVTQVARRFDSSADATGFLADLRDVRRDCGGVEVVEGDFPVDALGFATGDADAFEWVLVHANVVLSLTIEDVDEEDVAALHDLADEYASRFLA